MRGAAPPPPAGGADRTGIWNIRLRLLPRPAIHAALQRKCMTTQPILASAHQRNCPSLSAAVTADSPDTDHDFKPLLRKAWGGARRLARTLL